MTSGSRSCFRSWTVKVTRIVLPRRLGIGRAGADLGLGLAGLARLDPDQGLAEIRDASPSWNRSSGWSRNWISLASFSDLAVALEAEVGRHEVADLGAPFELGDELGVALEEAIQLGVDVGSRRSS